MTTVSRRRSRVAIALLAGTIPILGVAPARAQVAPWATLSNTQSVTAPSSSPSLLTANNSTASGLTTTTGQGATNLPVACKNNVTSAKNSYSALKNAETYAANQIRKPSGIGGCLQNIIGMNFSLGYMGIAAFVDQAMQALENMACGAAQQEWQSQVSSNLPGVGQNWNVPVVGNVGGFSATQTSGGAANYSGKISTSGGGTNFNTGSIGGNLFSGSSPGSSSSGSGGLF